MAKVLLVEDDNNLREIYQARLTAEGYDLSAAQNGEEALVLAKQNKPDLIISDVMMPRISGFEMLDILRNTDELKHTKVIMLTALGQAEDQSRADSLGADKYLVKSQVTLEDIVNAAKMLLRPDQPAPAPASTSTFDTPAGAPVVASLETPAGLAPITVSPVPAEPVAVSAPVAPAPFEPAADATVPASVVPQSDTTVVVPPAPANPTPPSVTTVVPEPAATHPVTTPPAPVNQTVTSPAPAESAQAVALSDSQSLAAEEAAVASQINNFATHGMAEAPQAAAPSEPASPNDAAIASAVDQLNGGQAEAPVSVTSPTTPPAPAGQPESVGGTKVIQPLNNLDTGPNLEELLAREAAQEPTGNSPSIELSTSPATPADPDPNSIAL